MIAPGTILYGFCHGYFGRDSYGDKVVVAVGEKWIVVLDDHYGKKYFNSALNIDVQEELSDCTQPEPDLD